MEPHDDVRGGTPGNRHVLKTSRQAFKARRNGYIGVAPHGACVQAALEWTSPSARAVRLLPPSRNSSGIEVVHSDDFLDQFTHFRSASASASVSTSGRSAASRCSSQVRPGDHAGLDGFVQLALQRFGGNHLGQCNFHQADRVLAALDPGKCRCSGDHGLPKGDSINCATR